MQLLFYISSAILATVCLVSAQADPAEDQACADLKYVDLQLRIINPQLKDPTQATLDKLAKVDSNPCPAERRPGNDAFYRQLYHAYVNPNNPDCSPEKFEELTALNSKAARYVTTTGPYAQEQMNNLFKYCKGDINLDVAQEKMRWRVTNPIDSLLLDQLTSSVYDEAPDQFGPISSETFEKGFRDSFLGLIGKLDSDYDSELAHVKDICSDYEEQMGDSYARLSQFNGTPEEMQSFNDKTEDAIRQVRVCEQAKTLTPASLDM